MTTRNERRKSIRALDAQLGEIAEMKRALSGPQMPGTPEYERLQWLRRREVIVNARLMKLLGIE